MTSAIAARASGARQRFGELLRFCLVGLAGLAVDIAVLDLYLAAFGHRPYSGQLLAWTVAVTGNWWLNRIFTFRQRGPKLAQWARFVAVNSSGALANYAIYAALVALAPFCAAHPAVAVGAGTLAGLAFNYLGSRRLVFRR